MDLFNLTKKEFEEKIDNLFSEVTKEELLEDLIECGLIVEEE